MQINRLFEIVYILLNQKETTAAVLAEKLEVSPRTIYRDIETLCLAGIPIYTTQGRGGGIALLEHFVLNKSLISETEQQQILMALQGLRATRMNDDDETLQKIQRLFGKEDLDWVEVDFSGWGRPEAEKDTFNELKQAIWSRRIVSFRYLNSLGQQSSRTVEPLKLVFKGSGWYLYGFCRARMDSRFFRLTRISQLTAGSEVFERTAPRKLFPDRASEFTGPQVKLRLKLDAASRFRVYDEFPDGITQNPDGSFLVQLQMPAGEWLIGYLLTFGSQLEVLEPPEIREELAQISRKINLIYKT